MDSIIRLWKKEEEEHYEKPSFMNEYRNGEHVKCVTCKKKQFCYVIDQKNLCLKCLYKICLCETCQPYPSNNVTAKEMCPVWRDILSNTEVNTLTFLPKK